jgi:hypothetical protein
VRVQLGADRTEHRVEPGQDGDGGIARQVRAHGEVEHQSERNAERKADER